MFFTSSTTIPGSNYRSGIGIKSAEPKPNIITKIGDNNKKPIDIGLLAQKRVLVSSALILEGGHFMGGTNSLGALVGLLTNLFLPIQ